MPARQHAERAPTPRFDHVDVLRGLSILAVVLLHTFIRFNGAKFKLMPLLPPWLFHLIFRNGGNGVTVFFAISGFLITLTSLRRFGSLDGMQAKLFYRIRFARIAPLLLLVLAVLSILHLTHAPGFRIHPEQATLPRAIFSALTFHLNWLEAKRGYLPANWDVLWSLSIEEMFYLFFPLACLALLRWRRGMTAFITILLLLAATGPFARTLWNVTGIEKEKSYLAGMSSIALGCLTALLAGRLQRRGGFSPVWRKTLVLIGSTLMLLIAIWPAWHHLLAPFGRSGTDDTLLALSTCMIILGGLNGHAGSFWTAPLRWFGRHSYEVYLTHEFVVVWMTQLLVKWHRGPLFAWVVAIVLLTALLGWAMASCFSEPMNRRLRGAQTPQPATL